jgi:hypothetical protein
MKGKNVIFYSWLFIVIENLFDFYCYGRGKAERRSVDTICILSPRISTVYDELERVNRFKTITSVLPSRRHLLPGVIRLVIELLI